MSHNETGFSKMREQTTTAVDASLSETTIFHADDLVALDSRKPVTEFAPTMEEAHTNYNRANYVAALESLKVAEAHATTPDEVILVCASRGACYSSLNQNNLARESYEKALALCNEHGTDGLGGDALADVMKAQIETNLATLQFKLGKGREAFDLLESAITALKNDADGAPHHGTPEALMYALSARGFSGLSADAVADMSLALEVANTFGLQATEHPIIDALRAEVQDAKQLAFSA